MKTFIILAIFIGAIVAADHQRESYIFQRFQSFMEKFNKKYSTIEEFENKYNIFKANYETVETQILMGGNTEFQFGVTKFFDMTPEEFSRTYLNLKVELIDQLKYVHGDNKIQFDKSQSAPENLDWRKKGAVSDVKNQAACGSCWAFSSTGNLEGQYFLKHGEMKTFSEQQLVDCDKVDQGCNGGLMENAFTYLKKSGGLMSEADYPYTATGGQCSFDKSKVQVQVSGYKFAPSRNEDDIKQMIAQTGPLAIAINANPLQMYVGGIYNPSTADCNPQTLDHGVLLVGYGVENGTNYWIVKNSWGANWGESGFFRIARGTGACGINTHVLTAEVL